MNSSGLMEVDEATFTINGKVFKAGADVPVTTSLNTFIREYALLIGTKYMCKEGSCGSCAVNMKYIDRVTKRRISIAVNSCLLPVFSCHGTAITTIEGLGSRSRQYNKVQRTLANFNGTQCGFCSPGFVMSMFSLLDANPNATAEEVEGNFGGNLCRCTGYRPILDAFKSLSSNPPIKLKQRLLDIEEARMCSNREKCTGDDCYNCMDNCEDDSFELDFSELSLAKENFHVEGFRGEWYRTTCVREIFEVFDRIGSRSYRLIAGNTARGVRPLPSEPDVYIDISHANDLKGISISSSSITFGSMTHLNDYIGALSTLYKNKPRSFGYAKQMAYHLALVASLIIRNRATIGGNLGLTNNLKDFPSDVFLLLDALGGTISVAEVSSMTRNYTPTQIRSLDLNKKVITRITLPAKSSTTRLKSFKVMPVNQNAVAIVNGAFLYDIDTNGNVTTTPSIVLSGINTTFRHAYNTEKLLAGKNLFNKDILSQAMTTIWNEIQPEDDLTNFSVYYRKLLGTALFYKSILSMADLRADAKLRSGGTDLIRPISSGKQVYQTDKTEYPLTQNIPKIEALIQCAGEARYVNDAQKLRTELSAQLVLAKQFADIASIDPTDALRIPGVVAFYSAKDIPGKNNVSFPFIEYFTGDLELFSSGPIKYWGQPVGMIVARTDDIAVMAVNRVKINYKAPKVPLLSVRDVLKSKETDTRVKLQNSQKAKTPGAGGTIDFSGEVDIGNGQYAHAMETPSCRVEPLEDGQYNVSVSTQTITVTNASISQVMGIPLNKLDTVVPRVGGSFGSKNTSQVFGACSCTLAASKLQTPVRMVMTTSLEMDSIGKRTPFYAVYKGKADATGKIQGMDVDVYIDYGYTVIMNVYQSVVLCIINYFNPDSWNINVYAVFTDKSPMLILRGPGFMESISIIETIMDHIAVVSNLDPINVRLANSGDPIIDKYITDWRNQTEFDTRKQQIDQYNSENRWKKKGLAMTASRYPFGYEGNQIGCTVGILYPDGTVQVQHGGIEMGQGLNTKVAQTVAYELGVPMNMVQIKATTSLNCPNATPTWTSIGSELAVFAAIACCQQLNKDLEPVKTSLVNPTWQQVVSKAFDTRVPLSANVPLGVFPTPTFGLYYVYGLSVAETELDVLTGQQQITRVDILADVGKSMSPEVDVGQIEGGFIMALGLLTTERNVYHPQTGALLTDRLWYYHIPRSKDIPIDFRVTFVPNATNPNGVLNSKATGEPSTSLAISVISSLRYGLMSAQADAGLKKSWIYLESPCTPETLLLASGTAKEQFIL